MDQTLTVDTSQVAQRASTFPNQARALATIVDKPSYTAAAEFLKGVKALRKEIADTFDPHISRAFQAHRALCTEKSTAEAPLTEAERVIKDAMTKYDTDQKELELAELRRQQEVARQQLAAQRLDEAVALEEAAQATGDAALALAATELLDAPIETPPVVVPKMTPKVAGITYRETWSGVVTDLAALVKHVALHPQYLNLLLPNMPAINALARSMRDKLKVPGIAAVAKKDVAASGR
jgi:hypothetical protein